ncbi:glycoside hydrolase family 5 protein [Amanita thiersii Skay4041]|uniref:glucan 1,3-beta-glucosidase n=1 Tax=Amanita thiersii Skay4041 TaxID=703135 RepID=A0A2A9NKT9_9AGAR|nr:glycoside hydrolase family 5 protein [Amanita thiersii Skay4041]
MSNPNESSRNVQYDPLPLTNDDHNPTSLYNAPPSPDPHATFYTPSSNLNDLPPDEFAIPPGAAQPRFLGAALYNNGSGTPARDSIASSNNTLGAGSEYTSSVYALNDSGIRSPLSQEFQGTYRDDPSAVQMSPVGASRYLEEKRAAYTAPRSKSRRKALILAVLAALILLIVAVVIPIYFTVIKPQSNNSSGAQHDPHNSASPSQSGQGGVPTQVAIVTGGDGSVITMEDGTTFTYSNKFGGQWYFDPNDPFNNGARAQSWTPALNETFNYGVDKIRGVNIGGWLNTEPVCLSVLLLGFKLSDDQTSLCNTPALYEPFVNAANSAVDEWTLSQNLAAQGKLEEVLENHYKTFITEQDFAEIAGAGLNFIRIPLPYWAIEVRKDEPFLPKVSWKYFLKAIQWARKYGLRINLDLHSLPGSQNGWNHSGRLGQVNFLNGPMGYANAQRSLDYIRILAEFVSQPQYRDVVTIFGIVNEPQGGFMGHNNLGSFYVEAYRLIRRASGIGAGKGPYISIHDGFSPRATWNDFIPNGDRIAIDSHPYLCFGPQSNAPISTYATAPCENWGQVVNNSMGAFGLTTAGEFSNAVTDCGLYLNGVNLGTRYEGTYPGTTAVVGDCKVWTEWQKYDQKTKDAIKQFSMASMDALQHYFFWTWKIGNSSASGKVETPMWSYKLGLDNGWMPLDPREAEGICGNTNPWTPPLKSWQTGGAGAGNVPAGSTDNYPWPPANINNGGPVNNLPAYTPTGPVPTLPPPTFTAASGATATPTIDAGNGWNNPADQDGLYVEIPGCTYLDPWVGPDAAPPQPLCPAGGAAGGARRSLKRASKPLNTPSP